MAPPNPTHVLLTIALLVVLWFGVPAPLPRRSSGPSVAECLTLADTPSAGRAGMVSSLERCRTLFPSDTELLADLGGEYEATGRFDLAEDLYRQAIAIDPAYADLRYRLGRLLIRRGDLVEAQRQAGAALKVQPHRKALIDLQDAANFAKNRR